MNYINIRDIIDYFYVKLFFPKISIFYIDNMAGFIVVDRSDFWNFTFLKK